MSEALSLMMACAFLGGCFALLLRRAPVWAERLRISWGCLSYLSLAAGLLGALVGFLVSHGSGWPGVLGLSLSEGVLTYCCGQTLFSDLQVRRADSRLFNLCILVLLLVNGYLLQVTGHQEVLVTMVVFALVLLALLPFPSLLAQGDTRALLLLMAAVLPPAGFNNLMHSLWVSAALVVAYAFYSAHKNSQQGSNFLRLLLTKASIPAVPLFLLPAVVILPLSALGVL